VTRERDRYRRTPLWEQVRDELVGIWRNRTARIVIVVLLAAFALSRFLEPPVVSLGELAVGDCVYLRAPGQSNDATEAIQVPATPADLQIIGIGERASCDLSHSHEVSAAFTVGQPAAPYPGLDALLAEHSARCDEAFEAYVGHPMAGSAYATALAVPSTDLWQTGARYGICFVFNADRTFMNHRAHGSGE
jgi:hypothetical protein